jgi:tetratricopeptide (TPR) repeat protein
MLGRALSATGLHERSTEQFEAAATLAGMDNPVTAAEAVLDQALAAWLALGPAGALPLTVRATDLCRDADDATRRRALAAHALIALQAGDASGLDESAEAARFVAADPMTSLSDLCWTWGVLNTHSIAATYAERFAEAGTLLDVAMAVAERIGANEAIAGMAVTQAIRLFRIGHFAEALDHASRATELAPRLPVVTASVAAVRADILLQLGRIEESDLWCARSEAAARATHQSMPLVCLQQVRAQRLVDKGMPVEACALYTSIEHLSRRLGIGDPCIFFWPRSAIATYFGCGRIRDALRLLNWLQQCAQRLPCRWPRIVLQTSHAMLAEARGEFDEAEQCYEVALSLHNEVSLPLEHIRTLLEYGSFLRRTGRSAGAYGKFDEALQSAQRIGDARHVELIRTELSLSE